MRIALFCVALAACTPEVVSGSYLCGPEGACPGDLVCNGVDDKCVLASMAEPFTCDPPSDFEPDDTSADAHLIELGCVSAPFVIEKACMLAEDSADWVTFAPPTDCTAVQVEARLAFPVAWEVLGLQLWDLDANVQMATDQECKQGADTGQIRRCLDVVLVPGTRYGLEVYPTGEGTCDGDCAYNRYALSVQLATP